MEEPWAVNPLVPVRLRPVTPKRMPFNASRTRVAENRALTPDGQGSSPWRRTTHNPLVAESADAPVSETGAAGHVRSTRTEGTIFSSPVAQRQSSALIRRPRAGLTQDAVAERMGTTKSAVSRLEAAGKHAPSLATLGRYASAVGCELQVKFVPHKAT